MKSVPLTRRRAIQTLFCSSAALALNIRPDCANAEVAKEAMHLLMIGDFGTGAADQQKVAAAMKKRIGHDQRASRFRSSPRRPDRWGTSDSSAAGGGAFCNVVAGAVISA